MQCTVCILFFSAQRTASVWLAIGIALSVRLSVCDAVQCTLWLSGLVYRAKSCTSMFIAGKFLFVPSDTFTAWMYRLATKRTGKMSRRKCEREFFWDKQSGVHWSCYVLLFTDFVAVQSHLTELSAPQARCTAAAQCPISTQTTVWCVHKLYPEESHCVPAVRRPIGLLVTETGLIASLPSVYERPAPYLVSFPWQHLC